jgi:Rne/Rng family ribonuclease
MSKEMVISASRHETRVALLEDDQLVEVHFQRSNEYSLAASIHKGRVTRVLPGMQSAFVDLGLERDTFLYVSDFLEENEDIDRVTGDERPGRERGSREGGRDGGRDGGREGSREGGREGGRDRDRRPAMQPAAISSSQPAPAQTASVEGEVPAESPVTTPGAGLSGPSTVPPLGRAPDQGDRDDRRGRRSRRRRHRGRGFPESKYADASSAPADAPASAGQATDEGVEEITEPEGHQPSGPAASADAAPLILPGESLRKYRGAPQAIPVIESRAAENTEADNGEGEYDEPIHYPPDNTLPDAPVHHPVIAETEEPEPAPVVVSTSVGFEAPAAPESPAPDTSEPARLAAATASPLEEEQAAEQDEDAGSGPAIAPGLDEDEDRDIQAMILGEVEGLDEDGEDQPEQPSAASVEPGLEAAPPETESGTAEVRERGGRFPHRVSRRTRRRGRGDGRPDNRPDSAEPRESAPPARPPEPRHVSRPTSGNQGQPSISDLLKEGQEIIVQIAKEPLGQKGARITSHIALPGRYVVYMPTLEHMGVSRKIASDDERLRLKRILQGKRPGPGGGFITRTAAEGRTEEEIGADMEFLYKLWQDIKTKAERKPAPLLLHHDLDIVQRVLRDQLTDSFKSIWIDNEELYENVVSFVQRFQPALVGKVKLYTREAPIFDAFGITQELEKALRPKVWLKSGGYIVINQTEALVAIDVNTGKYVGKSNRLEDTIVKTNTEAIKEIVRQIRLRDLGGIIVIDFIDMDERKNRQKVMQALEEAMRADRAPYKILQFNDFGLVAITRKRVKQSLERTLCSPCPHCDGGGYIKSVTTVISEILTEARKMSASVEGKEVMLRAHPDVAKVLKSHQNKYLEELEEILRRPVLVKSDPLLHNEKFDLA